jgi:hypothetical protein
MVMGSLGRIGIVCLALTLAVSVGFASDAGAKKSRYGSQVTLDAVGPDGASGHVSSGKGCRAQRHVLFYRVNSGPSVPSSEFVAATWTRGDGSWSIPGPLFPSEFFAVVQAKSAKRVVCGSDTSNSLVWG